MPGIRWRSGRAAGGDLGGADGRHRREAGDAVADRARRARAAPRSVGAEPDGDGSLQHVGPQRVDEDEYELARHGPDQRRTRRPSYFSAGAPAAGAGEDGERRSGRAARAAGTNSASEGDDDARGGEDQLEGAGLVAAAVEVGPAARGAGRRRGRRRRRRAEPAPTSGAEQQADRGGLALLGERGGAGDRAEDGREGDLRQPVAPRRGARRRRRPTLASRTRTMNHERAEKLPVGAARVDAQRAGSPSTR